MAEDGRVAAFTDFGTNVLNAIMEICKAHSHRLEPSPKPDEPGF